MTILVSKWPEKVKQNFIGHFLASEWSKKLSDPSLFTEIQNDFKRFWSHRKAFKSSFIHSWPFECTKIKISKETKRLTQFSQGRLKFLVWTWLIIHDFLLAESKHGTTPSLPHFISNFIFFTSVGFSMSKWSNTIRLTDF